MSEVVKQEGEVPAAPPPAEVAPTIEVATPAAEPTPETAIEAALATPAPPTPTETPAEPTPAPEIPEPAPAPEVPAPERTPAPEPQPEPAAVSSAATPLPTPDTSIKSRLGQALEALRFRKRKRLDKILQLAAQKGRIKNDDVEKLLRVSDSTAQRYLNQLVLEGRLRRSGATTNIFYERA